VYLNAPSVKKRKLFKYIEVDLAASLTPIVVFEIPGYFQNQIITFDFVKEIVYDTLSAIK
jgi:hypothetical protein